MSSLSPIRTPLSAVEWNLYFKGLAKDLKGGRRIRRRDPASEEIAFFLCLPFSKKEARGILGSPGPEP